MKKHMLVCMVFIFLLVPNAFAKSGSMKLLAVSNSEDNPVGSTANLFLEVHEGSGRVFIDSYPLSKIDTQISTRFAQDVACNFLEADCSGYDFFYTIRANSPIIGGPSAGAAITLLTISVLGDIPINENVAITGTINSGGIIGPVGGVLEKIKAASLTGIELILIPKFSNLNESNITNTSEKYNVEVIEVSQIDDALEILSGIEFSKDVPVDLDENYVKTMQSISKDLCVRARDLSLETYETFGINNSAIRLYKRGNDSLRDGNYYSGASFCFGSGLSAQNDKLMKEKMDETMLSQRLNNTLARVEEFQNFTNKKILKTLTDLEAKMVVTDRLSDARERIIKGIEYLDEGRINSSIYSLAYGIERLNSAHSWAVFFGKTGRAFDINNRVLRESCRQKISEVEERIQYVNTFIPKSADAAVASVAESYENYNSGEYETCLYKSSIAKAKVDLILNSIALDPNQIDSVIDDRSEIVRKIIAKQNNREIFPILAYSYYEYGNSLKETDKYSALLYLEYALELGNLDIYFEKEKLLISKYELKENKLFIFAAGVTTGLIISLCLLFLEKLFRRKKGKGKKAYFRI